MFAALCHTCMCLNAERHWFIKLLPGLIGSESDSIFCGLVGLMAIHWHIVTCAWPDSLCSKKNLRHQNNAHRRAWSHRYISISLCINNTVNCRGRPGRTRPSNVVTSSDRDEATWVIVCVRCALFIAGRRCLVLGIACRYRSDDKSAKSNLVKAEQLNDGRLTTMLNYTDNSMAYPAHTLDKRTFFGKKAWFVW